MNGEEIPQLLCSISDYCGFTFIDIGGFTPKPFCNQLIAVDFRSPPSEIRLVPTEITQKYAQSNTVQLIFKSRLMTQIINDIKERTRYKKCVALLRIIF
jgi:hypothetical protein